MGLQDLLEGQKAARRLPSRAERKAIRMQARASRRIVGEELGVSAATVAYWETAGDPSGTFAVAYLDLLRTLRQELTDETV